MTKDKEFLNWLADRLVDVYNESPNVDFVHKLKAIAKNTDPNQTTVIFGDQQQKFTKHLEKSSEIVSNWPLWKQNILGDPK